MAFNIMALTTAFKSCILYLIGFPGVGKLTIAREIIKLIPFRLVDNHAINNPIFNLHRIDGKTPFPDFVWDDVHKIRNIVIDSAKKAPDMFNFILTNALIDTPEDKKLFEQVEALAETRNACMVPVILTCSIEENARRIISEDRERNMKETNAQSPALYNEKYRLLPITHKNTLSIDVSDTPAPISAEMIVQHIQKQMAHHV